MQEKGFRNDLIDAVFAGRTENVSFDHETKNLTLIELVIHG